MQWQANSFVDESSSFRFDLRIGEICGASAVSVGPSMLLPLKRENRVASDIFRRAADSPPASQIKLGRITFSMMLDTLD